MNNESSLNNVYLNLRGTPCPVNFIKSSLAIEKLDFNQSLTIDLDKGEPEKMVLPGLRDAGHKVKVILDEIDWLRIRVISSEE
ncbi:sulfurtransferase TusA family protein [Prochlorococcus marinus]|uniref:UPF0033 domain-containing protein n=1 Tax=Prochlorococcus marinus (strain MIT 9211) TaxID=93059 RepID=A9B9L6_PROM4|nr:sulfurtransferase TusA family protein [Prochlorococcus marinus]ABX07949.1 Hypothetical protein P9211_00181 [Prochlorococcus marinus str. MIT 9211]